MGYIKKQEYDRFPRRKRIAFAKKRGRARTRKPPAVFVKRLSTRNTLYSPARAKGTPPGGDAMRSRPILDECDSTHENARFLTRTYDSSLVHYQVHKYRASKRFVFPIRDIRFNVPRIACTPKLFHIIRAVLLPREPHVSLYSPCIIAIYSSRSFLNALA